MDFILNGQASGSVATILMNNRFDAGALRPFIGADGHSYITVMNNGKPEVQRLTNNNATLRYDEWKAFDTAIIKAAKPRLRLVGDLRSSGLVYNLPNGLSKSVLETERQSDIGTASISMDGLRQGQNDRPEFDMVGLPLPIIHKDFHISARQLSISRNGGSPFDTTMAELAGRRVAEAAEALALGTSGTVAYAGSTVYGLTNFPQRQTKTLTNPATDGTWTPAKTVKEVLAMKQQAQSKNQYGPFVLYVSTSWDQYLDDDYSSAKGDNTLRERLKKIDGIQDVRSLDYLTGYQMILVQQTTDTIREVVGMDITTVQWESHGGLQLNFKVMAILVPQIRADINGQCGVVHGTAP